MMMIKNACRGIVAAVIFTLLMVPYGLAQQHDFRFWTSAGVGLEVFKDVSLLVQEEVRFKENCTQMDRQMNDLGINVKINKYFRTSLFYRIEADWKTADDYVWRHGLHADLLIRYKTSRFQFGYRSRFQSARIEFNKKEDRMLASMINRHKFKVDYNIKSLPLSPFAEGELFYQMNRNRYDLTDYRAWIGLEYTPGKIHEFSIKYGFDRERLDPVTSYIVALNYTVNLGL